MIGEPVDPRPFEPALPAAVTAAIAEARAGRGPAAKWLVARGRGWGQVGESTALLRGGASPELAGWLAGIAMFHDDTDRLAEVLDGHAALPYALEAFAAGVVAGVVAERGHWKQIDKLTRAIAPPVGLAAVVPVGCASSVASVRDAAVRIGRRLGGHALDALRAAPVDRKRGGKLAAAIDTLSSESHGAGAERALLRRLLDAWQATRAAAIEDALAGLQLPGAPIRDEATWHDVAARKDPVDVARLLDAPWPKKAPAAKLRVEALRKFPPDPRISRGLAKLAAGYANRELHTTIARVIERSATPSYLADLDALTSRSQASAYRFARRAALDIERGRPAEAGAARRGAPAPAARPRRDVGRAPRRSGRSRRARSVLADALQLAGDPRGELIALQASDREPERCAELIAGHVDRWLRGIPGIVPGSVRFANGFPVALRTTATAIELGKSLDHPAWCTLEELAIDAANLRLANIVAKAPLLRSLAVYDTVLLEQLAASGGSASLRALAYPRGWLPPRHAFPSVTAIASTWIDAGWDHGAFASVQRATAAMGIERITHRCFQVGHLPMALRLRADGPGETCFLVIAGTPLPATLRADIASYPAVGSRVRTSRDRAEAEIAAAGATKQRPRKADIVKIVRAAGLKVKQP